MAKLVLMDVSNILGNPTSAQNTINTNSDLIEAAMENTLSRDGTSPNQMLADFDMNGNDILNVGTIQVSDITIDGTNPEGILERALEAVVDAEAAAAASEDARDLSIQSAAEAGDSANLAQAWAEGTTPGGVGTKSAREWSEEAESWAAAVNLPPITPNTMLVDNAAGTARESKTFAEVGALLGPLSKMEVVTYANIPSVDRVKYNTLFATTPGRGGLFIWEATDFAANGYVSRPIGTTTAVNSGTGVCTLANHRLLTGQAVCVTTAANGLTTETIYYVIVTDANNFRLCSTFANSYPQNNVSVTLTGTTNFTIRRLMDPYQAIYVIPTGGSITGANGAWTRHEYLCKGPIKTSWWGVNGRDPTNVDDTFGFFFALDFAEKDIRTGLGGTVEVGKGQFSIRRMLRIGQRTIFRGQATYSTSLFFHSTITTGNCIELGPDNAVDGSNVPIFNHFGSYVFAASIEEMDINGGNIYRGADKAVIYTQADHQPARLKNLWIRGVVSYGVHWDQGLGGPANFELDGVDIGAGTTVPTVGTKTGVMLTGAGALVKLRKVNVQGGASTFAVGVAVTKDHLHADDVHFENCTTGFICSQNETLSRGNTLINVTGHSTVPTLINRTNPTKNSLICINVYNASTAVTGLVVIRDNGTNKATDALVPYYWNA